MPAERRSLSFWSCIDEQYVDGGFVMSSNKNRSAVCLPFWHNRDTTVAEGRKRGAWSPEQVERSSPILLCCEG